MASAYVSKLIRVDLTHEQIVIEPIDNRTLRQYIGGSGLAAKLLWEETAASTEPLAPENRLLFLVGPETANVPMGSRYSLAALSPATGAWGEAHSGGRWPEELKRTGYDGIVFQGVARRPVYLYVENEKVALKDATHFWGKDAYEVSDLLQKETDAKACVAAIGPAGEKLVPLAAVINDGRLGRAAARGGLGAVMGSKKLKAVVVRGTTKPLVLQEAALKESCAQVIRQLSAIRKKRGTDIVRWETSLANLQAMGNLVVKNFSRGRFDSFVQKMAALPRDRYYPCRSCPVGCSESTLGEQGRGIVAEALIPMGSLCLVEDPKALLEAWELCQRLGMDTISVGACVAFGMEVYEKGLITREDTEGVDLAWGKGEALVEMVKQIGEARGFGKVLGQGVRKAAQQIGGNASEFAMHVKGLELPLHEPRALTSLFLAYATGNRGGCHLEAHSHVLDRRRPTDTWAPDGSEIGYPPEKVTRLGFAGKANLVVQMQHLQALFNSLAVCNFAFGWYGVPPSTFVHWLNCITGWDMTLVEFLKAGERIFNLKRLLNLRRGLSGKDDTLPLRFFQRRPDVDPSVEAVPVSLQDLLQEYYRLRGWTTEGVPSRQKLEELDLPISW